VHKSLAELKAAPELLHNLGFLCEKFFASHTFLLWGRGCFRDRDGSGVELQILD